MREFIGLSNFVKSMFHKTKRGELDLQEAYEKMEKRSGLFEDMPLQISRLKAARERQLALDLKDVAANTTQWIDFLTALQKRRRATEVSKRFGF